MKNPDDVAKNFFGVSYESLDHVRKKVTDHIIGRKHIARNTVTESDKNIT